MSIFISVVIPTYNRAALLERALKSVLAQTMRNFEVVVIDDASTDQTAHLAEVYCARHPFIRYYRNDSHRERSFSRNRGIEESNGSYIACLDDDDEYAPGFLEACAACCRSHPEAGYLYTDFRILFSDGSTVPGIQHRRLYAKFSLQELCMGGVMAPPSASVFSKHAYLHLGGFRDEYTPLEDREFFSRIAMYYPVHFIDRILGDHHLHAGCYSRISDERRAQIKEQIWQSLQAITLKEHIRLRPEVTAWVCRDLAWAHLPDVPKARQYLAEAVTADRSLLWCPDVWALGVRLLMGQAVYNAVSRRAKRRFDEDTLVRK